MKAYFTWLFKDRDRMQTFVLAHLVVAMLILARIMFGETGLWGMCGAFYLIYHGWNIIRFRKETHDEQDFGK